MKRLISLIVIGGLVLSLCACDKEEQDSSSQTEIETEVEEITESETTPVETTEVKESETAEPETSETTTEETTISESETETESDAEPVKNEGGYIFIDCSGKSAGQIVDNILAIRELSSGVTAESFADRFVIAPQGENNYDDLSFIVEYNWFSDMVGSDDLFVQIGVTADFADEDSEILVVEGSYADVMIYLSDLDTAKEVYETMSYVLAKEYADEVYDGDADINEMVENDDRDEDGWTAYYGARYVKLDLVPNSQGTYTIQLLIDLAGA